MEEDGKFERMRWNGRDVERKGGVSFHEISKAGTKFI